jgi:hypothetical protein
MVSARFLYICWDCTWYIVGNNVTLLTSPLVLYSGNVSRLPTHGAGRRTKTDGIGNSSFEVLLRGSCSSRRRSTAFHMRGSSTLLGVKQVVTGISSATVSPSKEGGVVHLKSAHQYRRQHVELLISLKSGRRARQGGDEKTAACMQCSSSTCWWCFGFSWCQVA